MLGISYCVTLAGLWIPTGFPVSSWLLRNPTGLPTGSRGIPRDTTGNRGTAMGRPAGTHFSLRHATIHPIVRGEFRGTLNEFHGMSLRGVESRGNSREKYRSCLREFPWNVPWNRTGPRRTSQGMKISSQDGGSLEQLFAVPV